jgi:hypothetical protein
MERSSIGIYDPNLASYPQFQRLARMENECWRVDAAVIQLLQLVDDFFLPALLLTEANLMRHLQSLDSHCCHNINAVNVIDWRLSSPAHEQPQRSYPLSIMASTHLLAKLPVIPYMEVAVKNLEDILASS